VWWPDPQQKFFGQWCAAWFCGVRVLVTNGKACRLALGLAARGPGQQRYNMGNCN
jgi:hypothetical protein